MLKVGISGAGYAGHYFSKALKELGYPVVGIANRTKERGVELAQETNSPFYSSVEELVKHSGAEVLIIATSTERHVADIQAAAAGGIKNIFCEKPVGISIKETEIIKEISEKYDVKIGVGYKMRFEGIFATAYQLVKENRIGKLATMTFNFYQTIPHSPWYLNSGFVRETMVHPMDLACWFAGENPELVMCHTECFAGGEKEDRASLVVRFCNGVTASLNGGWIPNYPFISGRKNICFEIVGEGGYISGIRPGYLVICDSNGIQKIDFAQTDPIQSELSDYIMRMENNRPAAVGIDDAKRVQSIIKAAASSEISGEKERIQL